MTDFRPRIERHTDAASICCDPEWERAYREFESPEEEIRKFVRRLRAFGVDRQPKDQRVFEMFCGSGGGLVALERLGFHDLEGVDLSETLLQQYSGPARLHLADCRRLPFEDASRDMAVVNGGLHHLPDLPGDLEAVLLEVRRVLVPGGRLYVVEPWLTPFLRFAHAVVENPVVRRFYRKGDALARMIEYERETYEQWLGMPQPILELLRRHFQAEKLDTAWGKLVLAAMPRS